MLGSTGIGAAFMSRLGDTLGHLIALLSACTMFSGVFMAVSSAWEGIRHDVYLAVRKDAMILHWSRDREDVVPWTDVVTIDAKRDGAEVSIATKDGRTHAWEVRRGGDELAKRLVDLQKKAEHGLLGS